MFPGRKNSNSSILQYLLNNCRREVTCKKIRVAVPGVDISYAGVYEYQKLNGGQHIYKYEFPGFISENNKHDTCNPCGRATFLIRRRQKGGIFELKQQNEKKNPRNGKTKKKNNNKRKKKKNSKKKKNNDKKKKKKKKKKSKKKKNKKKNSGKKKNKKKKKKNKKKKKKISKYVYQIGKDCPKHNLT